VFKPFLKPCMPQTPAVPCFQVKARPSEGDCEGPYIHSYTSQVADTRLSGLDYQKVRLPENKIRYSVHIEPAYEYRNLEYVQICVIYTVKLVEFGIRILVAASQKYVNSYSTRRLVTCRVPLLMYMVWRPRRFRRRRWRRRWRSRRYPLSRHVRPRHLRRHRRPL